MGTIWIMYFHTVISFELVVNVDLGRGSSLSLPNLVEGDNVHTNFTYNVSGCTD